MMTELQRIEEKLDALTGIVERLFEAAASNQAVLVRYDRQIKNLLNSPPPTHELFYRGVATMALVTSIALKAGNMSPDGVQCVDSSTPPQVFPGSQISWSTPIGEANASDVGFLLANDGVTFNFLAPASAPTETVTLFGTWADPLGVQPAIVGAVLTVSVTAIVPPENFVAPMQYSETTSQ